MTEFRLLLLSPYSGRHGRKNENENRTKNRYLVLRSFQEVNGHKMPKKSVQKSPEIARNHWLHCLIKIASNEPT